MTRTPHGKIRRLKLTPVFIFLLFFAAALTVQANEKNTGESKRVQLNTKFRGIAHQMRELYQNGKLEQVTGLYETHCLKEGKKKEKRVFKKVNKEIRAEIYRLLYQSFTAMDKHKAADLILRRFLAIRPHEKVDKSDWVYIRKMAAEKYYVAPRFLVGITLGTNFTFMDTGQRYMVLVPVDSSEMDDYRKDYGFHMNHSRGTRLGIILEYALNKNISISLQPMYSTLNFQYKNQFKREREDREDVTLDYTHRHALGYIGVPVLLRYGWIKGKFKPYVQAGGYFRILTSAEKSLHAFSLDPENGQKDYEEEAIVDVKQQFTSVNFGFLIGGGLEYELGGSGIRLRVEINYRHGLNNISDTDQRFENKELMFSFYDVFDDMKPRTLALSVSVLLPISYKAFKK